MKQETKQKIRWAGILMFILYLCGLTYFLFFAESYGRADGREYSYNLIPFLEIKRFWMNRHTLGHFAMLTNLVGNVVGFLPFGAILPVINRRTRGVFRILLFSFEFSLLVETIQLVTKVGSFDVDDLMLNTLGGVIGYLMFKGCNEIRRKIYG
jgi:glycopeptide antibiotics resistance protein